MNDEEFYFEDANPKKVKLIILSIIVITILVLSFFLYYRKTHTFNVKSKIIVEIGDDVSDDVTFYVENKVKNKKDYQINLSNVSITDNKYDLVGNYPFQIKYKSVTKKGKIIVKDTLAPRVVVNDFKVGVNEIYELDDFITSCDDYSKPCQVELKSPKKMIKTDRAGTYSLELIISDMVGNKTSKKVKLTVEKGYKRDLNGESDFKIDHLNEDIANFDDSKLYLKFDKAIKDELLEENEEYQNIIAFTTSENNYEFYSHIPEEYRQNRIDDFKIIIAYNKENYVIGLGIEVTFDSKKVLYLHK